ncbi:MAG: PAS domain-containing protein [Gemmatimonadaceae bacterium]|nr:PAS domain-containing protein [Chitinophagaceae bacterium]
MASVLSEDRYLDLIIRTQRKIYNLIGSEPLSVVFDSIIQWIQADQLKGIRASVVLYLPDGEQYFGDKNAIPADSFNEKISLPLTDDEGNKLGVFSIESDSQLVESSAVAIGLRLATEAAIAALTKSIQISGGAAQPKPYAGFDQLTQKTDLHRLLMNAPALIAVLKGPQHVFELANSLYLEVARPGSSIVGKTILEAMPELASQGIVELLDSVYATGEPFYGNEVLVQIDRHMTGVLSGVYFNFIYQAIRNEKGEIDGIFVHAVDVSELVRSRKRAENSENIFRSFVLNSPMPIGIYVGREMRIELANDAILEAWGKPPSVRGKTFREALPELEGQPFYDLLDQVYTTGIPYIATEDRVDLVRNGKPEITYYNFIYKALRNERGEIYGVMNTAAEVTELVMAKQQLAQTEENLEQQVASRTAELEKKNIELNLLNENLNQFAYIASHDLQEPLRKINVFSDLLHRKHLDALPEPGQVYLKKIGDAARRMANLIADLLNFSKVTVDKEFQPTDLNSLINQIKIDYELLINEKQATLNIEPLCEIEAMPLQMNQLFYNIIGNALKFSKKTEAPVVNISGKLLTSSDLVWHPSLDPGTSYCEVVIADNGIGFDQIYAEQIFSIFQRLHQKEQFEGTGIGLALCRKIVDTHHGEIFARSMEGEGATFHIILPVRQKSL